MPTDGWRRARLSGALLAVVVACGRRVDDRADSVAGGGERPLPTDTRGATDTVTVKTPNGPVVLRGDSAPGAVAVPSDRLQWTPEIVVARLTSRGLSAQETGEAQKSIFDLPGTRVEVAGGRAEVHAFVFGDPEAALRAVAALDTTRVAPPGERVAWPMPPSLVVNNNLVAVVLTNAPALRDSIRYALTTHQR